MKGLPNELAPEHGQEEKSTNSLISSTNNVENKDRRNDLGPYGDDSSDDTRSSSSSFLHSTASDSDTDTLPEGTESEDDIDLELLHGLEEIHITVQRANGGDKSDILVPKGPQKTNKIRKQGKTASVPYQQQGASRGHHTGPDYPPRACVETGVDMVLSESLNDPGFRNNLLYTLEAEVEQIYPKLITPPLSSSDCSYPVDYNTGYSSNQHSYYNQYTPESLHSASPQGSDVSLDEENYPSQDSSYRTLVDSYYPKHQDPNSNSTSQVPLTSLGDQYKEHSDHYHNEDDLNLSHGRESNLQSSPGSDSSNTGGKPLANAEKIIDNMCTGVKYFLSSGKRHPAEVIDPYLITEDRAQSLLALARVIGSKLESLKETEKRITRNCSDDTNTFTVYEYLS